MVFLGRIRDVRLEGDEERMPMGEARRRSHSRAEILASADRCVYCSSPDVTTLEHMPPIGLFARSDRPRAMAVLTEPVQSRYRFVSAPLLPANHDPTRGALL